MKKVLLTAAAAVVISTSAMAADLKMPAKAAPPPPPPSPWDIAFGAGIASDYNFRGVSQSDKKPSVNAYFEPRYNFTPNLQGYVGIGGYSIDFPNRAAAEIDLYGGLRPTFGPLAFDFGIWYYWYPGGQEFSAASPQGPLPNGNLAKKDWSFVEYYGKVAWAVTDAFTVGGNVFYDPNWLNTGADGTYASATAKYVFPATPFGYGIGAFVSGEVGRYWLGTTDAFYGTFSLPDYTTWNVGLAFTWNVFTLDLRYYDTDLSRADCNALTSDHTASLNPAGVLESKWCDATFIAKLSFDMTLASLK